MQLTRTARGPVRHCRREDDRKYCAGDMSSPIHVRCHRRSVVQGRPTHKRHDFTTIHERHYAYIPTPSASHPPNILMVSLRFIAFSDCQMSSITDKRNTILLIVL